MMMTMMMIWMFEVEIERSARLMGRCRYSTISGLLELFVDVDVVDIGMLVIIEDTCVRYSYLSTETLHHTPDTFDCLI